MTDAMKAARRTQRARKPMTPARAQKIGKKVLGSVLRYALIICLAYLILAPLMKNIVLGFTDPRDLGLASSIWVPARLSVENWYVSYLMLDYPNTLPFTLLNTAVLMLLQTACALLAGYAFARLRFRFQGALFACVMLTIIVSPQVFTLPQYLYFRDFDILGLFRLFTGKSLNLLNNPAAMYLMAATGMGIKSGLFIYIFRQTFRSLPKELEEAAYIDGAGFIRTFTQIVLPSAGPGIITVGVLSYVWNWNDTYFNNLFNSQNTRNLMLAFTRATASTDEALGKIATKVPETYAFLTKNPMYEAAIGKTSALLVFLPLIVLYIIVQRRFVQGVERSGIVG